jgi:uncharacterized repeat protein (TIGR03803 family)
MKAVIVALIAGVVGCACVQPASATHAAKFKEKVLYSFCSQTNCTDGAEPGGLIDVQGVLYGTTFGGGTGDCPGLDGCGTVFSLDPSTGAETVLYAFTGGTDGDVPLSGLIDVNGILYGTTEFGGNQNSDCGNGSCGTVFAFDLTTGEETVLYSFCSEQNCADGSNPHSGLIDVNGTLYGTTMYGGVNGMARQGGELECSGSNCGTVFSLDPSTGTEAVVYSFCSQSDCTTAPIPKPACSMSTERFTAQQLWAELAIHVARCSRLIPAQTRSPCSSHSMARTARIPTPA